ncbi:hypothetical protein PROFUN_09965 [Planoprotostelium fungivorum]|uniref:Uncharacterized protein n=1 Tax=Planoprotostelium fungivorum TaxID=1890364 RepID=A0A2P6NFG3_9EUKA|nr:hypothetical protein PROFUN_09965 [Planoprotostelium fungivorum]
MEDSITILLVSLLFPLYEVLGFNSTHRLSSNDINPTHLSLVTTAPSGQYQRYNHNHHSPNTTTFSKRTLILHPVNNTQSLGELWWERCKNVADDSTEFLANSEVNIQSTRLERRIAEIDVQTTGLERRITRTEAKGRANKNQTLRQWDQGKWESNFRSIKKITQGWRLHLSNSALCLSKLTPYMGLSHAMAFLDPTDF